MASRARKVYFYQVSTTEETALEKALISDLLKGVSINQKGKEVELKHIYRHREGYLTAVLVTTKTSGIPPKHTIGTDKYEQIRLQQRQGLAYANALLYDPRHKILALEFNKYGAYPPDLIALMYNFVSGRADFPIFQMELYPLLSQEAYERILGMNYIKRVRLRVANPTGLLTEARAGDSLQNIARTANLANATDSMEITLTGEVTKGGLNKSFLSKLWKTLKGWHGTRKVSVEGYRQHGDKILKEEIDLLLDRLSSNFKLEQPDILSSILQQQRQNGIRDAYENVYRILQKIIQYEKAGTS